MSRCIKQNESDTETYFYEPGFSINYDSSSSSSSLKTNIKYNRFSNQSSSVDQSLLDNKRDKKSEIYSNTDSKGNRLSTEHKKPTISSKQHVQRSLRPAYVADRCRIAIVGSGDTFSTVGHAESKKYEYKRNEKQKNVSNTKASVDNLKDLYAYSKTDSEGNHLSSEYQKFLKPTTASKHHNQRSLCPASVADRCRIAIEGSGNTFSTVGHAESKKYAYKCSDKQKNVSNTKASVNNLKDLYAYSNTNSKGNRLSIEHQKFLKPTTSSKLHIQRSLSPVSVADRCRIAITGSGNSFSIEGHAESKRYRLEQKAKFR